eukprot:4637080-Pleurochrysis_carterae.AAC.1
MTSHTPTQAMVPPPPDASASPGDHDARRERRRRRRTEPAAHTPAAAPAGGVFTRSRTQIEDARRLLQPPPEMHYLMTCPRRGPCRLAHRLPRFRSNPRGARHPTRSNRSTPATRTRYLDGQYLQQEHY